MTVPPVAARRRARAPRWTAPLAALGSLVVLAITWLYWGLAQMTFLEVHHVDSAALNRQLDQAAQHATTTADTILPVAATVVLCAGLLGAIRPIRRGGLLILVFTWLALTALWAATRADVALIGAY